MDLSTYGDGFLSWLQEFIPGLIQGTLIILVGWYAGLATRRLVLRSARRLGWDEIIWGYLGTIARYLVVAIAAISGLKKMGFPVDALLATFGISGVIIGLGARQSISNYFRRRQEPT